MNDQQQIILGADERHGISGVETWAQGLVIKTPADYDLALNKLKEVKSLAGRVKDFFAESKTAAHAAWKAICSNEASFLDKLSNAESMAKRVILAYQQEQEFIRQKEQARLQAEADEKARIEREKLEAKAKKLAKNGKTEQAEALKEQAQVIEAPVIAVESKLNTSGSSIRKTWKAELVSMQDLVKEAGRGNQMAQSLLMFDQSKADGLARSMKGTIQVKGVTFREVSGLSVSTR